MVFKTLYKIDLNDKNNIGKIVLLMSKTGEYKLQHVKIHEIKENEVIAYDIEGFKLCLPRNKFDFKLFLDEKDMKILLDAEIGATMEERENNFKLGEENKMDYIIFKLMLKEQALFEDRNDFFIRKLLIVNYDSEKEEIESLMYMEDK